MDYSHINVTDNVRLETIRKSRPTIPYSQFPRRQLQRPESNPYHSLHRVSDEERDPDDISIAASPDSGSGMEEATPSGHRRRRSTLTNSLEGLSTTRGSQSRRAKSSMKEDGIAEDPKWSDDEDKWSADDSKSTSEQLEMDELLEEDELRDDEEAALTGADKEKRRRRRRRNTLLDHRIAGESKMTEEEKKEADQYVLRNMLVNGVLIGLWYLFSLSISIYNKWMFSPDHLNFTFPLFTTCMHMLVQFTLSALVLFFLPQFRPRYDSISNPHSISHLGESERLRHEADGKKPLMTRWFYITRLGPCGMATGLDIGMGNMSLKFITLTFYTMCKSSALAFVLGFAFVFRLETPSWKLVFIILTMTGGVIMMVAGEVDFNIIGFVLVISAAFFSGFRWGLTQILLLRNPATSNPFSSIFFLAPIMFVSLILLAIPVEGFGPLVQGLHILVEKKGSLWGPAILLFPGTIAFLMTSSEFALLQRTSVVTLSIAGIFKEVVTISAAALVFHDPLTPINISGLFVTIGAIAAYNYIKISKMRAEARVGVQRAVGTPDASGDVSSDSNGEDDEGTFVTQSGELLPVPGPGLGKLRNPLELVGSTA
ncbi:MAG: Triose-phosphate Transporter [Claussenomyces sp. TS43310]|nr:MAG: Triose-phosphate Transporter [Claussenomyces sp. TS43310]